MERDTGRLRPDEHMFAHGAEPRPNERTQTRAGLYFPLAPRLTRAALVSDRDPIMRHIHTSPCRQPSAVGDRGSEDCHCLA